MISTGFKIKVAVGLYLLMAVSACHQADQPSDHDLKIHEEPVSSSMGRGHVHTNGEDGESDDHDDHESTEERITDAGEWEALVGLQVETADYRSLETFIQVPGRLMANANTTAVVGSLIEASINTVFVDVGDRVKQGQELACVTSPQIGLLRAEYEKAGAELAIRRRTFNRRTRLYEDQIISERVLEESELSLKLAEMDYHYARKCLLALGVREQDIEHPPAGHSEAVGSTIHLIAPISGIITFREASIGQNVDPSHRLFQIMDIGILWCEADIFEKDLSKVRVGQKGRIQVNAYDEFFEGRVFYVGDELNPETRTVKVLIELQNPYGKLKPGMFADVSLVTGEKPRALAIPKRALLEDEGLTVVFVKEGESYHRHILKLGLATADYVEVLEGLNAGDRVVTQGNYQLRSRLRMQGVDAHAGHVH